MAGRKARPRPPQPGWSAFTQGQPLPQAPLLPSFPRELPPPDLSQFAPLSSQAPPSIPAIVPSFAGALKQHRVEDPLPNNASSLLSLRHILGPDPSKPLDSRALALSRLRDRHSWADAALISDILQALDLDEERSDSFLLSMFDDNMERLSASETAEQPVWPRGKDVDVVPHAREETSEQLHTEQRGFDMDAGGEYPSSFLNAVPIEPEWEVDDLYLSSRRDALKLSRASGKHARGACNAYMSGDYWKANLLSKQSREEGAQAKKLHAAAAKQILRARNIESSRNLWRLDLHGLHANEAVAALQERLLEIETAFSNDSSAQDGSTSLSRADELRPLRPFIHGIPFSQELQVITGVGNHSRDGGSLPKAIRSFLIQNRYKFEESKPGVVAVWPKFKFPNRLSS